MKNKSNNNTLENYAKHHKDFTSTVSSELNLKGFEGDVSIDNNSIIVDVDVKDKLNKMKLTDEFKEPVKSGFEQSLDFISDGVEEGIQNLEEKTKIKNLTVTININCGAEILCTRTYSLK